MNAIRFRKAIERLDLSQVRAGKLVGRDGRTGQRWVVDGPSPEAAIIFQMLIDGTVTTADIERARERAGK
jgi:hypothetical protein